MKEMYCPACLHKLEILNEDWFTLLLFREEGYLWWLRNTIRRQSSTRIKRDSRGGKL